MHALQDRQREGCRLTGAGLCRAEEVAALEQIRDGGVLNRCGAFVAFFAQGALQGFDEVEI